MFGLLFAFMVVVAAMLVLAGGMRWIDSWGRKPDPAVPSPEVLERLESALGSLESRVDALQDQQRFLERLLAERPGPDALRPGDRGPDEDMKSVLFDSEPREEEGEER